MPSLSFTDLGIWVVAAIVMSQAYFAWRRHQREQEAEVEPRHTPAIDDKIAHQVGTAEKRLARDIGALREEKNADRDQLHGRISGLREEIKADLEKNSGTVEGAVKDMRETYALTVEKLGGLDANQRSTNQRLTHVETKLDRHIERDKQL